MDHDPISRRTALQSLGAALALPTLAATMPGSASTANAAEPTSTTPQPFTISKETTFFTSPVSPDGFVDYAAALNQRLGAGVTPAENAAVPLLELLGPGDDKDHQLRDEFFRRLGIPTPREKQFFSELEYFEKRQGRELTGQEFEALCELERKIAGRPWQAEEFPELAAWLKEYGGALDIAITASERPHYFVPLSAAAGTPVWNQFALRSAVDLSVLSGLQRRSALRIANHQVDLAFEDAWAALRLAAHSARGAFLPDLVMGSHNLESASEAMLLWLKTCLPSAAKLRALLSDLQSLPQPTMFADMLHLTQRCDGLSRLTALAQSKSDGVRALLVMRLDEESEASRRAIDTLSQRPFDYNTALRTTNHWSDRCVDIARRERFHDRLEGARQIEQATEAYWEKTQQPDQLVAQIESSQQPAVAYGEWMGEIPGQCSIMRMMLFCEAQCFQWLDHLQLAVALSIHRAEHGQFPEKLEQLKPAILAEIPLDRMAHGQQLPRYRRDGSGYMLYSLGENGKDNGGRVPKDPLNQAGEDWDDVLIHFTPAPIP